MTPLPTTDTMIRIPSNHQDTPSQQPSLALPRCRHVESLTTDTSKNTIHSPTAHGNHE
jgi:hypothetical protein